MGEPDLLALFVDPGAGSTAFEDTLVLFCVDVEGFVLGRRGGSGFPLRGGERPSALRGRGIVPGVNPGGNVVVAVGHERGGEVLYFGLDALSLLGSRSDIATGSGVVLDRWEVDGVGEVRNGTWRAGQTVVDARGGSERRLPCETTVGTKGGGKVGVGTGTTGTGGRGGGGASDSWEGVIRVGRRGSPAYATAVGEGSNGGAGGRVVVSTGGKVLMGRVGARAAVRVQVVAGRVV